jgi:hypothetical protein
MTELNFCLWLEGNQLYVKLAHDATVNDLLAHLADNYPNIGFHNVKVWRGIEEAEGSCPMKVFNQNNFVLMSRK